MSFEREDRYIVLKRSDIAVACLSREQLETLDDICRKVRMARVGNGKPDLECVVVESDWPEYEPTWAAIERRMTPVVRPTSCGFCDFDEADGTLLEQCDRCWKADNQ